MTTQQLREKISNWLYDRNNNENDLVDFLVDECGVVIQPWEDEEEDPNYSDKVCAERKANGTHNYDNGNIGCWCLEDEQTRNARGEKWEEKDCPIEENNDDCSKCGIILTDDDMYRETGKCEDCEYCEEVE